MMEHVDVEFVGGGGGGGCEKKGKFTG